MKSSYQWNDKIKIKTKDGRYLTEKELEKLYLLALKEEFQKDNKKKVKVRGKI